MLNDEEKFERQQFVRAERLRVRDELAADRMELERRLMTMPIPQEDSNPMDQCAERARQERQAAERRIVREARTEQAAQAAQSVAAIEARIMRTLRAEFARKLNEKMLQLLEVMNAGIMGAVARLSERVDHVAASFEQQAKANATTLAAAHEHISDELIRTAPTISTLPRPRRPTSVN